MAENSDVDDFVAQVGETAERGIGADYDWGLDDRFPFAVSAEPWIRAATEHLDASLLDLVTPGARLDLQDHLRRVLCAVAGHAILREFVTEVGDDDSRDGYQQLMMARLRRGATSAASEYLEQLLARLSLMWVAHANSLLANYAADRDALTQAGLIAAGAGRVASLSRPLSDRHDGGRYVVLVTPEVGPAVVYKPRALDLEAWFFANVDRLNPALELPLLVPRLIGAPTHGWMEYVQPTAPTGAAEVQRFARRLGAALYLSYMNAATDLHGENVVIAGEHPVVVDLECLFTPAEVPEPDSVLSVGILPTAPSDPTRPDRSALGWRGGRPTGVLGSRWFDLGTGAIGSRPTMLESPPLSPPPVRAGDATAGFDDARRAVDQLGLDPPPRDAVVRVLLRATHRYERVLRRARNTAAVTDADAFRNVLRGITRGGGEGAVAHPAVLEAELDALERFDIPRFDTTVAGRSLRCGSRLLVADAFRHSGEAVAQHRSRSAPSNYIAARNELERSIADSELAPLEENNLV